MATLMALYFDGSIVCEHHVEIALRIRVAVSSHLLTKQKKMRLILRLEFFAHNFPSLLSTCASCSWIYINAIDQSCYFLSGPTMRRKKTGSYTFSSPLAMDYL